MKLSSKGQHRLFFALDFQDDIKQAIARWCATLAMNGRPVAKENYHLTLQFLGNVNNHQVFDIIDAIDIPNIKPFTVNIGTTGYFPKQNILFAEVDQDESAPIDQLVQYLTSQLKPLDFIKRAKKRFHPHITLARDAEPPLTLAEDANITATFHHLSLMESISIKSGVHYEVVEQWPLYKPSIKEQLLGRQNT